MDGDSIANSGCQSDRRQMAMGNSLVGHSWGGGRHASRVAMDVLGVAVAAAEWSVIQ